MAVAKRPINIMAATAYCVRTLTHLALSLCSFSYRRRLQGRWMLCESSRMSWRWKPLV